VKCPQCNKDQFIVYSTDPPYKTDNDYDIVRQHRKCKNCGHTGITTYQKWVCEQNPEDYSPN